MHIPGMECSLSPEWPTTLTAGLVLWLCSQSWSALQAGRLQKDAPWLRLKIFLQGNTNASGLVLGAEDSSQSWLGRRQVKYSLTIPFAIWTQINKGRIRESACDLFRSVYIQKRADGGIMILSICKQSALNFILAVTRLPDRIRALLHVGKDLLFESLHSAWIPLWISSDKHPSAILLYFYSPKSFIFKNYFFRWIYFTHHVNYLFLFKNEE